jgi:hypothetical protein
MMLAQFSGFDPIITGLNSLCQRFLVSKDCACLKNLDVEMATIETKERLSLE